MRAAGGYPLACDQHRLQRNTCWWATLTPVTCPPHTPFIPRPHIATEGSQRRARGRAYLGEDASGKSCAGAGRREGLGGCRGEGGGGVKGVQEGRRRKVQQ